MSVHKKLMEARIRLQSIKMKKSGLNKFAGYDYFELSDFIPHVQKIFHEIGLCGVVSYEKEIARLTITDIEDNSEIVITSPMAGASLKGCHEIQNLGAVETYTRRYLWVAALEIVEHDMIDSSKPVDSGKQDKPSKPVLTPENKAQWEGAKKAFLRDKNLTKVLERVEMSRDHQLQLIAECENAA
jgi:hypothetical protein